MKNVIRTIACIVIAATIGLATTAYATSYKANTLLYIVRMLRKAVDGLAFNGLSSIISKMIAMF